MEQMINEQNVQTEKNMNVQTTSNDRRENAGVKLLIISLLCLLLLVPWFFIRFTISERNSTESSAEQEVYSKWGGQ